MLESKKGRGWRDKIEGWMGDWWETLEARANTKAHPVNPQRVVWEMSPRLPENAIVTSDSGSCANWYARDYRVKRGQLASLSGGLASMGAAVPYAIGAKFAHPDRPVVALVGDGAMQMNNMAELITIAKYYERWPDKRLVVCVFNNEDLNEVTWEQRVMNGNPRYDASQDIPDVRYSQFAEQIGLKGIFVDKPKDLASAWDAALSADRPVVLEVKTDPEIAPLPPHISFKEAKGFMMSMVRDDDAGHVIRDTARQVINKVLHREDAD
jgi:pyruvate dehydrogenase (quinone)